MITWEQLVIDNWSYSEPKMLTEGPYAGHWAHIAAMLYTNAVMVSDSTSVDAGPIVRWCYQSHYEARKALDAWNGIGDPPGDWIKQKPGERQGPGSKASRS